MKSRFLLLIVVVILALAATPDHVAAYEPEGIPVHPTLMDKYEGFFPPAVLPVTDGIWVARGYNRDNPVLIEGVDGMSQEEYRRAAVDAVRQLALDLDVGEVGPEGRVVPEGLAQVDDLLDVHRSSILARRPRLLGPGRADSHGVGY